MPRPAGNSDQMWSLCFTRHVCTGHRMTLAIFSSVGKRGSTHIITPTRNLPLSLRKTYSLHFSILFFPSFLHFAFHEAKENSRENTSKTNSLTLRCVNFYDELKNIYIFNIYLKINNNRIASLYEFSHLNILLWMQ